MGDPASGHGRDKSAAYVIDLTTGEFCVEYHAKVSEDVFADDLYWLGKWFNTALIGVETQGGNGTATVIALRDGSNGRPPYPKLYRHRNETRRDHPDSNTFGMPMDPKNRNLIVNQLETWVRERSIPFVTDDLHYQMTEFVFHDHGPSPAARDGSHDDCVFAAGGAIDLFRRYGGNAGPSAQEAEATARRGRAPHGARGTAARIQRGAVSARTRHTLGPGARSFPLETIRRHPDGGRQRLLDRAVRRPMAPTR
jgi:hypothetical protein